MKEVEEAVPMVLNMQDNLVGNSTECCGEAGDCSGSCADFYGVSESCGACEGCGDCGDCGACDGCGSCGDAGCV